MVESIPPSSTPRVRWQHILSSSLACFASASAKGFAEWLNMPAGTEAKIVEHAPVNRGQRCTLGFGRNQGTGSANQHPVNGTP
jgi:hypothetical protein